MGGVFNLKRVNPQAGAEKRQFPPPDFFGKLVCQFLVDEHHGAEILLEVFSGRGFENSWA
ncbi:MAG: hypothetical protein HOM58_06135 [Rhodospirillaceae bacterium]|nr:hypothetical protein [Rhodospirillaceae bacterium]MBT5458602.1 hypothetical protein [Rhodospirillaceae bacterium]